MRNLLHTNTGSEHLANELERTFITHVGRDGSKMVVCPQSFFVR